MQDSTDHSSKDSVHREIVNHLEIAAGFPVTLSWCRAGPAVARDDASRPSLRCVRRKPSMTSERNPSPPITSAPSLNIAKVCRRSSPPSISLPSRLCKNNLLISNVPSMSCSEKRFQSITVTRIIVTAAASAAATTASESESSSPSQRMAKLCFHMGLYVFLRTIDSKVTCCGQLSTTYGSQSESLENSRPRLGRWKAACEQYDQIDWPVTMLWRLWRTSEFKQAAILELFKVWANRHGQQHLQAPVWNEILELFWTL